jgi:hypothetical protein
VFQEYVLGGSRNGCTVHCGSKAVSSKLLEIFVSIPRQDRLWDEDVNFSWMESILRVNQFNIAKIDYWNEFDPIRSFRSNASFELESITYWLNANRSTTATDPRDKVYAILGLVNSLCEHTGHLSYDSRKLIIDYKTSVEEVYESVVKTVVLQTGCLEILWSCGPTTSLIRKSWVPDWTTSAQLNFMLKRLGHFRFFAVGATSCIATF